MSRTLAILALSATVLSAQGGPTKVTTVRVASHRFTPKFAVLGELEAKRTVQIGAEVAGRVASTEFEEGERFDEGESLLHLDTKTREIAARGAKARLEVARQQLAEYKAGARPEEILESEAGVERAKALLAEAEEDLERERGKQRSDIGSQKSLTVAAALAATRRAELASAEQQLALVRLGPRVEQLARAEAEVALRQSEVDAIEDEIQRATIKAPFTSAVVEKHVGTGSYVRAGDPVASLVQIDPIRVTLSVPERNLSLAKIGSEVRMRIDAFHDEEFRGEIKAIVPRGDKLARSFPVRLEMANKDGRLLPGMFVRAELEGESRDGMAVPRDAVVTSGTGSIVYTVVDGKASIVPVTLGEVDGDLVEIRGPLASGAEVIVRGNDGLRPGTPVVVLPPADSAPNGATGTEGGAKR
ncbi:MAG: efflux RND transporter periplasmic adaptor subunit [Planctomycetes bacterium]|nr:efflux RND transporter periplasmic adaptor subunit [Planctomycetota bacterium]